MHICKKIWFSQKSLVRVPTYKIFNFTFSESLLPGGSFGAGIVDCIQNLTWVPCWSSVMRTPLISEVVSLHPPLTARKWTWLIDVVESEICRVFHVFPREGGSGSEGGRKKGRKVGAAGRLWKWGAALNFSSGFLELIRQPSKESRTGGQDEERRCSGVASSLMKSDTPT